MTSRVWRVGEQWELAWPSRREGTFFPRILILVGRDKYPYLRTGTYQHEAHDYVNETDLRQKRFRPRCHVLLKPFPVKALPPSAMSNKRRQSVRREERTPAPNHWRGSGNSLTQTCKSRVLFSPLSMVRFLTYLQ